MEAAPPRGRPEFDFDHITVHHLRLNKNAESTKSPHQMWSPTRSDHRKPLEGREGRTAGERERSWERTRLRSDLCRRCRKVAGKRIWRLAGGRRDSVAGGPAIRRRGRGSQLTDWVEVHQFFFFQSRRTCGDLGQTSWRVDKQTWFWQWGFSFVLERGIFQKRVRKEIDYFTKISIFCF